MNDLTTSEIIFLITVLSFILSICLELYEYLLHGSGSTKRKKQPELAESNLVRIPESRNSSSTSSGSRVNLSALKLSRNTRRWWKEFEEKNIFALDAEHVFVYDVDQHEAATIAIVDFNGGSVYSGKIFHPKGSFLNDQWTRKNLNLKDGCLDNGTRLEVVRRSVLKMLENKLVILVDEWKDWDSLYITPKDIKKHNITTFDLHKFWRKPSQSQRTKDGGNDYQPIGLRSLMMHYFKVDIQEGIHSADVDARATMQLFREIYPQQKLTYLDKMEGNEDDFDRFARIPTIK